MRAEFALITCLLAACGDPPPQALATAQTTHSARIEPAATAQQPSAPTSQRSALTNSITSGRHSAIVEAAARVAPAVVSVNVTRRERRTARSVFDFFFLPRGYERLVQGIGSGFIITPDGIVVTNQHVTAGAEEIVVTTRDGQDFDAVALGEDPLTDIAVLKIDGRNLPTAPIGTSSDLLIGEWVVAIGNPYGYLLGNSEPSVTAGVISAVRRNLIPSDDQQGVYVGMIQTDAAINPGNSGGPLANALGEVVGVNSSIFSESGGSVGIGFAIPIERALRVAHELREHGEVRHSWIGLTVAGSERMREWKLTGGLEVTDVAPGSPADRAGVRSGDVLVSANGRSLRTFLDWEAVRLDIGPGDALSLVFQRGDAKQLARVRVADLPTARAAKISALGDLELISVTPAIQQERRLRSQSGALIYQISQEAQRRTGLRRFDVILRINRQRITDAEDVPRILRAAAGRAPLSVYFERGSGYGQTDFYVR